MNRWWLVGLALFLTSASAHARCLPKVPTILQIIEIVDYSDCTVTELAEAGVLVKRILKTEASSLKGPAEDAAKYAIGLGHFTALKASLALIQQEQMARDLRELE